MTRKAFVDLPPEEAKEYDCIHKGALPFGGTCFSRSSTRVHLDCWLALNERRIHLIPMQPVDEMIRHWYSIGLL